jgi:acyl-CoA hydrolase
VVLQLVARRGDRISLSSNPDTVLDLLDELKRIGKPRPFVVGVVHPDLPYLGNTAEVPLDLFDLIVEEPGPAHRLFGLPREPVTASEFALGLHAASLVQDGGSLQIGIGALSDALVYALVLRHRDNEAFKAALAAVRNGAGSSICDELGGEAPFQRGLYGASEMVMDGFMHLREAGILTRRVFDDIGLQTALNEGRLAETLDEQALDRLLECGLVPTTLDRPSVEWLMRFGFLPEGTTIANGQLLFADGQRLGAELLDTGYRRALAARMAGRRLRGGQFLHGGFYLGSTALYDWLRGLEGEDYDGVGMTRISHINELYGGREMLEKAQRRGARFFNTCMMQTLSGAAVSDGLEDGQIVSGVGGQYNFVAMAHALPDGRSVLMLRAARDGKQGPQSNIVWHYGHTTIARHLRDLVVTEYGVADLHGASDEEIIQRTLAITDARFIDELAARAKAAGKLSASFVVPDAWRSNTPEALAAKLAPFRARGLFPTFPFGSDFDEPSLRCCRR